MRRAIPIQLLLLVLGAGSPPRPVEPARNPHAADVWRLPPGEPEPPPDPGALLYRRHCMACHSTDYVSTQPRLTRKAWVATVEKMRSRYGAPIPTNDLPALLDDLVRRHGAE